MSIIKFPGAGTEEEGSEKDDVTAEFILKKLLEEEKLSEVFIVGIREGGGQIVVSGNCTIALGVYLAEIGKDILVRGVND